MRAFLVTTAVDVTLVASIAWIASRSLRQTAAQLRYRVWIAAAIGALVVACVPLLPSLWSVTAPSILEGHSRASGLELPLTAILAVWMCGTVIILISVFVSTMQLNRIAARARPASSEEWRAAISDSAFSLGVSGDVRVLMSADQDVPITWGIRRNTILLPASAATWDDERRKLVLMHEFAHIARRDYLAEVMLWLLCAVYWFHPAAWIIARNARIERERICDEKVISLGVQMQVYAEHLVAIMRQAIRAHRGTVAGIAFARPGAFEQRVNGLLALSSELPRSISRITFSWATVTMLFLIPIATPALRQPRVVNVVAGKKKCDCAAKLRARAHSTETMQHQSRH